MRVVGIDVSTYIGMYLGGAGEEDKGKVIHLPDSKGFSRLRLLALNVGKTLDMWKPELVMIEGYSFGSFGGSSSVVTQVEIGTVVRIELFLRNLEWYEVAPTTLKKWTTGNGHAKKADMAHWVGEKWGFNSHSDDIIDAFALVKLGQSFQLTLKGIHKGVW